MRQPIITNVEVEKRLGVVTDVYVDPDTTIEVLTESDVKELIAEETGQVMHDIDLQNRKLAKVAEQAKSAAKDAAEAKEEVERLVETARDTFHDVIEEQLAPLYRFLAMHLGIELPVEMAKPTTKMRPVSTKKPSVVASSVISTLSAKPKKKTIRQAKSIETEEESSPSPKRKTTSALKKSVAQKKPAALKKLAAKKKPVAVAVTHPRKKGAKPCPKK